MKHIYKTVFLFLLVPTLIFANNGLKGKHTKTKTIKKEFSVSANATVDLDNKYGSIDIQTWDQNKVILEIIITTDSNKESKAQDKLDDIHIEFENSSSRVSVKTKIEKSSSWSWSNNSNVNMDIQYIVRMPKSNDLIVDMDYGDVMLDVLSGKADINLDYGKLIAGELLNVSNTINMDYSQGTTIDYLKNGDINTDYSTIEIDKAGDIDLVSDYCTITIHQVNDISFNLDYGNLNINDAHSIEGNSDYTNLKFGTIENSLIIDADYGNLKVDEMGINFTNVDVTTEYIGVKIGIDSNSSFKFYGNTQYGDIDVPSNMNITNHLEKNTRTEIEGTYNGSKGQMKISTQYGSIKITEN
ncbi:MAG: hypothetical protein QM478_08770 [Flavobacteriaceae bacterium]